MSGTNLRYILLVNIIVATILILLACGGGGGGGGIIPPISGGDNNNQNTYQITINSTQQAYIIISTKQDIDSSQYSFNFSTPNTNTLAQDQQNTINNRRLKCGFIPSQAVNPNILYSQTPPQEGDVRTFQVINRQASATCMKVNHNPQFAIWLDNDDNLTNAQIQQIATRFAFDYNTLINAAGMTYLPFYVHILISSDVDPSNNPQIAGYFFAQEDPHRINIHPVTITDPYYNYGGYNEGNVTTAHEFVHLLSYHATNSHKPLWLEEGLSTYGEELCGYQSENRLESVRYFLRLPDVIRLDEEILFEFENYGKSYLFMKLLNQRFNNAWRNILSSTISDGVDIVEDINGSESFQDSVEIFNIAVLLDIPNNPNFGFNNIDLNTIDRNGDNSGNDKGVFKYDERDNDGFENQTLREMRAASTIYKNASFYIYKTDSGFNGIIRFITPPSVQFIDLNVPPIFNQLPNYRVKRIDSNTVRITVIYK